MELYYDFNKDFKEVKNLFIEEKLSKEDLEEGLEPLLFDIKVCLTNHAYHRMHDTEGREVDWEDIENFLLLAGEKLLTVKNKRKVAVVNKNFTAAIIGNTHYQDGGLAFIIHTIIRVQIGGELKKIKIKNVDNIIIVDEEVSKAL